MAAGRPPAGRSSIGVAGVNRLGQGPWSEPTLRPAMSLRHPIMGAGCRSGIRSRWTDVSPGFLGRIAIDIISIVRLF